MCVCVREHVHTCMCVCVYVHIHVHVHMHINTKIPSETGDPTRSARAQQLHSDLPPAKRSADSYSAVMASCALHSNTHAALTLFDELCARAPVAVSPAQSAPPHTQQHTAAHVNRRQQTAAHGNTLQHLISPAQSAHPTTYNTATTRTPPAQDSTHQSSAHDMHTAPAAAAPDTHGGETLDGSTAAASSGNSTSAPWRVIHTHTHTDEFYHERSPSGDAHTISCDAAGMPAGVDAVPMAFTRVDARVVTILNSQLRQIAKHCTTLQHTTTRMVVSFFNQRQWLLCRWTCKW